VLKWIQNYLDKVDKLSARGLKTVSCYVHLCKANLFYYQDIIVMDHMIINTVADFD